MIRRRSCFGLKAGLGSSPSAAAWREEAEGARRFTPQTLGPAGEAGVWKAVAREAHSKASRAARGRGVDGGDMMRCLCDDVCVGRGV